VTRRWCISAGKSSSRGFGSSKIVEDPEHDSGSRHGRSDPATSAASPADPDSHACAFLQCPIRFASGVFACLLLVVLVGIINAEAPTRFEIIGAGVLRFRLTEDRRPLSFAEVSSNVEGIDVDMAMSLA
jgi:hypothetical protein